MTTMTNAASAIATAKGLFARTTAAEYAGRFRQKLDELDAKIGLCTSREAPIEALKVSLDLPIEQHRRGFAIDAATRNGNEKVQLVSQRTQIERAIVAGSKLSEKYPMIDIAGVPWLSDENEIQLVPFNIASAEVTISRGSVRWSTLDSKSGWVGERSYHLSTLADKLGKCYERLPQRRDRSGNHEEGCRYAFTGSIPETSKNRLAESKNDFLLFDGSIVLISDLTSTQELPYQEPRPVDPILTGWRYDCPDVLWYIDSFDVTPLEQLIVDEALRTFIKNKTPERRY